MPISATEAAARLTNAHTTTRWSESGATTSKTASASCATPSPPCKETNCQGNKQQGGVVDVKADLRVRKKVQNGIESKAQYPK